MEGQDGSRSFLCWLIATSQSQRYNPRAAPLRCLIRWKHPYLRNGASFCYGDAALPTSAGNEKGRPAKRRPLLYLSCAQSITLSSFYAQPALSEVEG